MQGSLHFFLFPFKMKIMSYKKFVLMLAVSFIIMYSVMFLNVDEANHIYLSITRTYMALLMVLPMAVVMIMGKMYPNKKTECIHYCRKYCFVCCFPFGFKNTNPGWRCSIYESDDTASFFRNYDK